MVGWIWFLILPFNHSGLVDAEVGGSAPDFGVALAGGRILFGMGTADETIHSSTNVVNGGFSLSLFTLRVAPCCGYSFGGGTDQSHEDLYQWNS